MGFSLYMQRSCLKGTGFSPYMQGTRLKGTGFSPYINPETEPGALAPEG